MAERSDVVPSPRNPLTRAWAAVWHPTPASMRFLALLGVIGNAGIIATGGAVRVTKSGLGCPDWPKCTGDSLVPTAHPDHAAVNMAIEFGNRMLTFLVLAIGVAVFVAALRLRPRRRDLVLLATAQPASVFAQAIIGGIVVLTELHPASVGLHFLISPALLIFCVALWVRAGEGDEPVRPLVADGVRRLILALIGVTALLMVAGVVVTGTGPHAGDAKSQRWGFNIEDVARIHSAVAWLTVALTVVLLVVLRRTGPPLGGRPPRPPGKGRLTGGLHSAALRSGHRSGPTLEGRPPRPPGKGRLTGGLHSAALRSGHRSGAPSALQRRAVELFVIEMAQGVIGYVQYFTGVPAVLVVLHMLGSAIMWIAVLRLIFAARDRGPLAQDPAVQETRKTPQPA
ncbi:COX15/CtaA family protein [Actinomadura rudentiformis]|uniref:COX15/CtaA family protein n=1 Tax=Actinomadura rudentiformis TaxID=359158 RepID=UPI001CEF6618|nr:COX15/CtaA family protein [Actinomadura rudentiformis]